MNYYLGLLFLFVSTLSFSQNLTGEWKGIIKNTGQSLEDADILYFSIQETGNKMIGKSRIERFQQDVMAIKSFNGSLKKGQLQVKEDYVRSSTDARNAPLCKLDYELSYTDSTGYLKGTYRSTNCRNNFGKIILFQMDETFNESKKPTSKHLWKERFVEDYKKGYAAPKIRKIEQLNFEFEPIYFDHDKFEIRPVHYEYLNEMARVLDGIHDLRVKVIGNTDAVGTDQYNVELSKRRAKAIKDYFKSCDIDPEKLEIDFKGERNPVSTNKTKEGKQLNRRVDFAFI